jgi:adenosylhomocysteinase
VRWASCNIFSTQDHAGGRAAGGAPDGTPESPKGIPSSPGRAKRLEQYWDLTERALDFGGRPRAHADRGRRRRLPTLPASQGPRVREGGARCPIPRPRQRGVRDHPAPPRPLAKEQPGRWAKVAAECKGVRERPPPACTASTRWQKAGTLLFPASTSTTA